MARQLTVFIENRPGALSEITEVLSEAGVNIVSIMVEGEHDFGFARIQAHSFRDALAALEDAGFQVKTGDVLVLQLANRSGELHDVLERLAEGGVNVQNMFGTVGGGDAGELVLSVDDPERAKAILELD